MKTDIWKKIFVSAGAALSVIMIIIGNVNDIFSFFEMMKQIFNEASLPIKFLYVGLITVGVGVLVGVVIFSIVHIRRKEKKMRLMNEFLAGVQSYKEKKTTDYVKPFVSKSFDYLMAKNSQGASQYNAEKMMAEGIEVYEYQAALAKKIARADDVNSCMKAYELLDQVINSWHVFINKEKEIISYWIFIALYEESYIKVSSGNVNEMDIELKEINFIDVPGRYFGYLLLSGTADCCKTQENRWELYDSWIRYIEELAKKGIFFNEIASMVGSEWGNSSLRNIGMKEYAKYKYGGNMYKYNMKTIQEIEYLKKQYPNLVELYKKEYEEDFDETIICK